MANLSRKEKQKKRHCRIRNRIYGSAEVPRMSVYLSSKHIYIQFIDDILGKTLAASSTLTSKDSKKKVSCNCKGAEIVGKDAAEKALSAGIKKVIFDRGGFKYHGRIKMIAENARAAGLEF